MSAVVPTAGLTRRKEVPQACSDMGWKMTALLNLTRHTRWDYHRTDTTQGCACAFKYLRLKKKMS